eukprot:2026513-Pleurochrysis_carterae.AAC.1
MPGRKSDWIATSPCGRSLSSAPTSSAVLPALSPLPRGSGLRRRSRLRRPCGSAGCGARRSPGSASSASAVFGAGARFRIDAKGGGVALAASMRARTVGVRQGPSATRPPSTATAPRRRRAARAFAAPATSASASVAFIAAG